MAKWKMYGFPRKIIYTWWFIMVYHGLSTSMLYPCPGVCPFLDVFSRKKGLIVTVFRCFCPTRTLCQFYPLLLWMAFQSLPTTRPWGKQRQMACVGCSEEILFWTTQWWFLLGKSTGKRVFPLKPIGSSYTDDCISLSIYSIYKYLYL